MKSNLSLSYLSSIRWKLIAAFLLVVFIPTYLLHRYAIAFFDRYTRQALETEMVAYAFITGEQYKTMISAAPEEDREAAWFQLEELLRKCGPEIQSRIRIISPEGKVIADSHDESTVGKDFSQKPEVKTALGGSYGARSSLSDDSKYLYYFVAWPIKGEDGKVEAVAHVSRHTGPIMQALTRMRNHQRRAMLLAVIVAFITAIILAFTITQRLRRLTRAARAFARGTAPLETRIGGRDEIGELAGAMKQMASEIDRRNRYNRDFLSETMHELKTPLTAIKGAVELLEQGAADKLETRGKFLSNIRYETERLIRMVGELTQLTMLDAEVLSAPKETVDYCNFLRQFIERLKPTFEPGLAELKVSIPETKYLVNILPGKIEQVITNLLDNAFRYTPAAGTVELSVAEGPDKTVVTTVRDSGSGISPANLSKVFDRFFTTEPKDREKSCGSGLGLTIARSIVENHGGRIWVESQPGQGAAFHFSLKFF